MHRLFVYGALRRGASNDWRMKDASWLGPATVPETLIAIDWYPGLVLTGETQVKGEVYEIDDALLAELDAFEGIGKNADDHPGEYHRIRATVDLAAGPEEVWIYEWLGGLEGYSTVESGDWLTRPEAKDANS